MDADAAIGIMRETLLVTLELAGPILAAALTVGTIVSILQAATQINEATLSFLPKLIAVGLLLWAMGGWMLAKLSAFSERIFDLVATAGGA